MSDTFTLRQNCLQTPIHMQFGTVATKWQTLRPLVHEEYSEHLESIDTTHLLCVDLPTLDKSTFIEQFSTQPIEAMLGFLPVPLRTNLIMLHCLYDWPSVLLSISFSRLWNVYNLLQSVEIISPSACPHHQRSLLQLLQRRENTILYQS